MNESDQCDQSLAELLTLTMEMDEWGLTMYRNHLGQLHRIHGPAVIYKDGGKGWYQNDNPHRTDGPAYVTSSGYKEWWLDGEEFSEEEWNERIKSV